MLSINKKKIVFILVVLIVCVFLAACGQISEESQAVIDKINTIGTITEESGLPISEAEDAYAALTEEQRKEVNNYQLLADARAEYDRLLLSYPIEFVKLNWDSTVEDMQALLGKWEEKDPLEGGGATYHYTITYHNMKGWLWLTFGNNNTLTCATFIYKAGSLSNLKKCYDIIFDEYTTKYGVTDRVQESPISGGSSINFYDWYRKQADISIVNEQMEMLSKYDLTIRFIPHEE